MRVFKRKDRWWIDFTFEGRRYRESTKANNKALAAKLLHKRMTEVAEGKFFPDKRRESKVKFEELAEDFMRLHSEIHKKASSIRSDISLIKSLVKFFKGKRISDITCAMIEEYKSIKLKKVTSATVNRELACLKCMLNKAVLWGKLSANPAKNVRLLKENNARLRFLSKEEIARLLDNCAGHLRPVVTLAVFTGMRKGEILNLKWQDIDIQRGLINIYDSKNGTKRESYINETVKRTLIAVRKHPESPYVFCRQSGEPYYNLRKSFFTACKKSGIVDFRFHDLRHTFASQLVMSGVDIKTIQELLGHKSIEMTLRYSHLAPSHKSRAVELLDQNIDINLKKDGTNLAQSYCRPEIDEETVFDNSLIDNKLQSVPL
jgi:integrase